MTAELETGEGLVRICVPLERTPEEAGPPEDWLWAEPLGSDRYRIESCSFFAYGVSRDDVVRAEDGPDGAPRFDGVVEKSGHRTLRFALDPAVELSDGPVQVLLERLLELGCTYEALRPKLVAVDLPPDAELERVAEHLQALSRAGALVWEWVDPRPS